MERLRQAGGSKLAFSFPAQISSLHPTPEKACETTQPWSGEGVGLVLGASPAQGCCLAQKYVGCGSSEVMGG